MNMLKDREQPLLRIVLFKEDTIHFAKRGSSHKQGIGQDRRLYTHVS